MASIRKYKGKWRVQVRTKGESASASFETRHEALSWSLKKEQEFGKGGGVVKGITFGKAMLRYAREESVGKKGARWEMIRLESLARDSLGDHTMANLTRQNVQDWITRREKEVSGSTVNRELNLLAAVIKTSRFKWNYLRDNVLDGIVRPKNNPHRDRRVTEKEIQIILTALDYDEQKPVQKTLQKIAVAFLFAIETAMRYSEIFRLEWDRVFLDKFYVRLVETKNGTKRDVPLSARAVELLRKLERKDGRVFDVSEKSAEVLFRKAVKRTGIDNLHFHDTRHEATTRLAEKLSVLELSRVTGHKDLKSLRIYYNPDVEDLAAKIR
jgi:integrase